MKRISQPGFPYTFDPQACSSCEGRCCAGESGRVWVNTPEIDAIVSYLESNSVDFVQEYLVRAGNRWSLAERRQADQSVCVFYDIKGKRCKIYLVRPAQCRTFPFWEYYLDRFAELLEECPGVRLNTNENSSA